MVLRSLWALGPEVRGDAPRTDYLYLLLCLAFLRLYDQDHWAWLRRHVPSAGDPRTARMLLRRAVEAVDASLGCPDLLSGMDAPPARLRPRAFEPVRNVVNLAAGLLPDDFARLRSAYVREARAHGDMIYTPKSVTRTMVALLASHTVQGEVRVYDPFARFGELLAEFVQECPAAIRVYAEHPHPAGLRLARMWLAATCSPAELAVTPSPPQDGATFLLTNPPFGNQGEPAWLQRCVDSLAEDGRAAVLMPYRVGFAADGRTQDVRRELVEQGAILAVIALPARMFLETSIGVCVWLLRRPAGHPAPVQLVDAHQLGQPPGPQAQATHVLDAADIEKIATAGAASDPQPGFSIRVTPDEIRAHGYSLHPPEYQNRTHAQAPADAARAELDALLDGFHPPSYATGRDEGWPRRRLRDLCHIRAGVPYDSLKRAKSRAHDTYDVVPVIHPRHLRSGLIDASDAPIADATSVKQYRLHTGDVLWVRTGAMGQTAIVRHSETDWAPFGGPPAMRALVAGW